MSTEDYYAIPVPGTDLELRGILREVRNDSPVVIFVHGFTGHENEAQFYNGARALGKAGFSSFRFGLYGLLPTQRKAADVLLSDHVDDVDTAIAHFKRLQPKRKISVIGHSLGGIVTLLLNSPDVAAAVLWDPANSKHAARQRGVYLDSIDLWRIYGFVDMLIGDSLMQSWVDADTVERASQYRFPTAVISAGAHSLTETGRLYADLIPAESAYFEVPDADHCFHLGDAENILFEHTVAWLTKHGR